MQVSYSQRDTQSILSVVAQSKLGNSSKDKLDLDGFGDTGSSQPTESAGASFSAGYSSLQSTLAKTDVDRSPPQGSSSSASVKTEKRNAAGQTLKDIIATTHVINPAEWLSASDEDLFHKVTGGTIKNGVIYDKDGVADGSQSNADLVCALYEMRNEGTFDKANLNRVAVTGDLTVEDVANYLAHYSTGGFGGDITGVQGLLDVLKSQEASASGSTAKV
jgi:hypothetical protein